ncbi:hypothetical protein MMC06_001273 [Schaereria dolodes]|nr:hypothetical protein [Schaereria dolodes]
MTYEPESTRLLRAKTTTVGEQARPLTVSGVDTTYLDHAGTTLYAKSLIEAFAQDMTSNLYGNPHSGSASSQLSTRKVEAVRLKVLEFFGAKPEDFDVVFVSNATAGIKLVADAFRDLDGSFWYGYHRDSHNSVIGVREVASAGHKCFESDADIEAWLSAREHSCLSGNDRAPPATVSLFAYPAQSNFSGHRLPLCWSQRLRNCHFSHNTTYTLLDASSYVSTSPLSLSDSHVAPDFTVLSFYKIFGFPPLGCLIIRKAALNIGSLMRKRKYFGGGTVDMVTCLEQQAWHMKKTRTMHDHLEDGTLAFHNIIALGHAIDTQRRLYGSMENVARHTTFLSYRLYSDLSNLRHRNSTPAVHIYTTSSYLDRTVQGPIIAFNLLSSSGKVIPKTEVEAAAAGRNIQLRTGGMCNPGGVASTLSWTSEDIRTNYKVGVRCGDGMDIVDGKPTGILRASLGAMSNLMDVQRLVEFVREVYLRDSEQGCGETTSLKMDVSDSVTSVSEEAIIPCKSSSPPASRHLYREPGRRTKERSLSGSFPTTLSRFLKLLNKQK